MTDDIREATEALEQARAERDKLPQGAARQAMNRALDRAEVAISKTRTALEARTQALRYFIGAQHPVSTEIDERGHRWVQAYLDEALPHAVEAMKDHP